MRPLSLLSLAAPLLLTTTGCATFASNISGDFECRAKDKSVSQNCQPASRIDADAIAELAHGAETKSRLHHVPAPGGDTTRTRERILRIVFPAHVDNAGILHEESVAWAVADTPDWAARLRRQSDRHSKGFAGAVARALKAAQQLPETAGPVLRDASTATADTPLFDDPFAKASPLALPSTAREAIAGAKALAVEGFDMPAPLPHDRTPRHPVTEAEPVYPSADAIDAAKSAQEPE